MCGAREPAGRGARGIAASRSSHAQWGVYLTWLREYSFCAGKGISEKKGPHITVTAAPRSAGGGSISAISASSCRGGTQRAPEAVSSALGAEEGQLKIQSPARTPAPGG